MTTTAPDAEKASGSTDESADDDVVDTPAAHIQTTATLREVDVFVDEVDGMARLTIRSTDISGSIFLEPDDSCRIGDRLLTIGMEEGDCNL